MTWRSWEGGEVVVIHSRNYPIYQTIHSLTFAFFSIHSRRRKIFAVSAEMDPSTRGYGAQVDCCQGRADKSGLISLPPHVSNRRLQTNLGIGGQVPPIIQL